MFFDPNETKFANEQQRIVWQQGIHIVPLDVSLADIEDKETREGVTQIYNCVMEIFSDMYHHSEYYLNIAEWQIGFFLTLALQGKTVKKSLTKTFSLFLDKIPQFGFIFNEDTNTWTNAKYPLFCEYYLKFADLYKKRKQNMGNYLQHLDFRLFLKKFNFTFDDILRPLPHNERALFLELRNYAIANGMKEKKQSKDMFRYTYKNLIVIEFRNNPARVTVPYGLKGVAGFELFLQIVESQSDTDVLVKYIQDNIQFCDGCAANIVSRAKEKEKKKCGYYKLNIRDKMCLSCAANNITTSQYSRPNKINVTDIPMLERMADVRIRQINKHIR